MSTEKRQIIQIGAPKTASTTLQIQLFARHPGLTYTGVNAPLCGDDEYKHVTEQLNNTDDLYYRHEVVETFVARYSDTDKPLLWSHEGIIGCAYPSQVARRLKRLLPDAHILLVIRNQLTALMSYYSKHGMYLKNVPKRYLNRYVPLDEWLERGFQRPEGFPLRLWRYAEVLSLYEELFGRDKIHILLYEDFVHEKKQFIGALCEILQIDAESAMNLVSEETGENVANPVWYTRCYRIYDRIFKPLGFGFLEKLGPKIRNFVGKGKSYKARLPAKYEQKAIEVYAPGNRILADKYRLADKLQNYDYPL